MNPMFLITLLVLLIFFAVDQLLRRHEYNKVERLFVERRTDELLMYLDKPYSKMFFPTFNRQYMIFNAHQQEGNIKNARKTLDGLLGMKCTPDQRHDLVIRAFEFYLRNKDFDQAKAMLEEINPNGEHSDVAYECRRIYQIVAEKSHDYIVEMEGQLAGADDATRRRLWYLLSLQYDNEGSAAKAQECRTRIKAVASRPRAHK